VGSAADVPLERSRFAALAPEVAPRLLNLVLVHGEASGRIVEVEAYNGAEDAASHAYRGMTARNRVMFGPPGHLYVYFTYGMHCCANVVCGPEGRASAVLIRALEPLTGLETMRRRRGPRVPDRLLAAGPGRLCQALGIDRAHNGADLLGGGALRLVHDGAAAPVEPVTGTRIGLSARAGEAGALRWRFAVRGSPWVSRPWPGDV